MENGKSVNENGDPAFAGGYGGQAETGFENYDRGELQDASQPDDQMVWPKGTGALH